MNIEVQAVQARKRALRDRLRAELRHVSPAEREAASTLVREQLRAQALWRQARAVLVYAPLPTELDLWPLAIEALEQGRAVALPRYQAATDTYQAAWVRDVDRDLILGRMNIREPADHCPVCPLNRLDLTLVPGLGFDLDGRRLGRGKGYYDRFLTFASGLLCGVAMDRQILPAVPVEPHDRRLDCIVTPTRWLRCGPCAV